MPNREKVSRQSNVSTAAFTPLLAARHRFWSSKKASSEPTAATAEEAQWRAWVDTTFVKLLTANIYSTWTQSFQTMKYITESGQWGGLERALAYNGGAVLMYAIGSRMPKKYGFEGDLRELLYKEIDSFIENGALLPWFSSEFV